MDEVASLSCCTLAPEGFIAMICIASASITLMQSIACLGSGLLELIFTNLGLL